MDTNRHVNHETVEKLFSLGGNEFLERMISLFKENMEVRLNHSLAGMQQQDFLLVERASHSIVSSAGNLGAERLMRLAREGECWAKQKNHPKLMEVLPQLEEEYRTVRQILEQVQEEFSDENHCPG
jgi:HPt (histidine-containing phosphotransfer) domain-containing protein